MSLHPLAFNYIAPKPETIQKITDLRASLAEIRCLLEASTPNSAERTIALHTLHQFSMQANFALVAHQSDEDC